MASLYGNAPLTGKGMFDFFFNPQNIVLIVGFVVGLQIAIALIASYKQGALTTQYQPTGMATRALAAPAAARPVVPVVNPQAAKAAVPAPQAPKLVPVAQKKTQPEQVKPTLAPKAVTPVAPVAPVAAPAPASLDSTYEAYRSAMLGTGPRAQLEAAKLETRAQLETKSGNMPSAWRQNAQNLKLGEDTAEFLSRTNVSVNDRMVAIFDAVKA